MITLNLIEKKSKQEIIREKFLMLVRFLIIFFISTTILICLLILGAYQTLRSNLKELKEQNTFINTDRQTFQQNVGQINNKLRALETVQKETANWTEFLSQFTATVPSGVRLTDLSLTREKNLLSVAGWAAKRDDFLLFKKQLEESGLVNNLDSPLSNLLTPENISFSLTAQLNLVKPQN
jgi:Tfp pilus assembly protein PilN